MRLLINKNKKNSNSLNKQKGLALITVLFVFALVSLLAISMQKRQVMSMSQASATFNRTQAMLLAISAEDIAKAFLKLDGKRDQDSNEPWDSAPELWNQPFPTELSGAEIFINIRDLQGLFNINSITPRDGNDDDFAKQRFERLLDELQLPATIATQAQDWLNVDSSASYIYQNLEPAYSASGIAFSHPSELLLLEAMDSDMFKILEPYVTALPVNTPLNINTTHEQILNAWDVKLKLGDAKTVVDVARAGSCGLKVRNDHVFESTDDLWADDNLKELVDEATNNKDKHWNQDNFSVNSKYFSVFIQIKLKDDLDATELILESIIKRDMDTGGFIGVVYRDFSRKIEDITTRLKIINC